MEFLVLVRVSGCTLSWIVIIFLLIKCLKFQNSLKLTKILSSWNISRTSDRYNIFTHVRYCEGYHPVFPLGWFKYYRKLKKEISHPAVYYPTILFKYCFVFYFLRSLNSWCKTEFHTDSDHFVLTYRWSKRKSSR